MDLILWRHADAEDPRPGTPDHKRRLTGRGERQAEEMAEWLASLGLREPRVYASPASRAQQTAHALGWSYKTDRRLGIGASTADLIAVADWPEYHGAAILIGHQPSLGRLAALLLSGTEADWTIKKAGAWWFSNRTRSEGFQTVLRAVCNPSERSVRLKAAA